MKILFLHLSDLHIKGASQVNLKVDKIVSAVHSIGSVDKCILICSGDLAYSGNENEYKSVRKFFHFLLTNLGKSKNQFIESYFVPGNHDMIFPANPRKSSDILEYYKECREEEMFSLELKSQGFFFEYAKSKKCFIKNNVVDSILKKYNGYKIQFNLINTAPFSTLKQDNKEIHYLPDAELYSLIKEDEADLAITVMHHSTEWFHWKTKDSLEKVLRTHSDIVFQGHEHTVRTSKTDYILSKGGEFSGAMSHKSTFSTLVFDTKSLVCEETEFQWNDEQTMFCRKGDLRQFTVTPKTNILVPNSDYISHLLEDPQKLTKSILDYFVFPKLFYNKRNAHKEGTLVTEDSFWDKLFEQKIINVSGKSRVGKTTFLKYIFSQCMGKKMVPLYFGSDAYYSKSTPDKILKNLFSEQYGENEFLYEKYDQLDSNKKVLLIDDFDLITNKDNQENLIRIVSNKVDYIIFTSKNSVELDITKIAKDMLLEAEGYYSVKIDDFYREKRTELVRNICRVSKQNATEFTDYLCEIINRLVDKRHGLFELSPEYIAQYVKYFLNRPDDRKGEAVFNVIFETNIRNAILQCGYNIEHCLIVLEEIAFQMHKKKNEHISHTEIITIIDELSSRRGLTIDNIRCLDTILSARILKESGEKNVYEFYNHNYLAYFIAKKINKLIEKNGLGIPELQYIFTNICFGINDNILLFLSFLRENTAFAINLCEMLNELVNEIEELDFDKNNVSFIKLHPKMNVSFPTPEVKQGIDEASENGEKWRREHENEEISFRGVYDYNESDANTFHNRIVRAIKYLEIISKSLISHFVNLDLIEKNKIIELMYSAPNRILFALLKPFDNRYEEVIDKLKGIADSMEGTSKWEKEDIAEILSISAISLCLSLYDSIAFLGVNSETLQLLNKVEMRNSNDKIVNLIMEENGGRTDNFINKAIKLKEDEKDEFINSLIKRIVRKHLITRTVDYKLKDKVADKIFSSSKKRLILDSLNKHNKR